ncbi:hypothetical protein L1049_011842 [Liquidambar formosana]|uniref:Glycosyltransferase N-terminal domain-containing protein n=1 Tax=Liquidambar formosana TaxID=63359 RepID=A0AAP0RS02_LIQFO
MDQRLLSPQVLIFPFPVQGHVNSMLKLAELLSLAGLHVTFLNSDYNHRRLLNYTNIQARFARYPHFRFETISDGLPADHPRSSDRMTELFDSIEAVNKPLFREMLISGRLSSDTRSPVTCVIADGILSFAIDAANEIGVMSIAFRTVSACSLWTYFCFPKLVEAGELPFKGNEEMDQMVTSVAGMEGFLRRRDLPSSCRVNDLSDPTFQLLLTETVKTSRAHALILNTFEELDAPRGVLASDIVRTHAMCCVDWCVLLSSKMLSFWCGFNLERGRLWVGTHPASVIGKLLACEKYVPHVMHGLLCAPHSRRLHLVLPSLYQRISRTAVMGVVVAPLY